MSIFDRARTGGGFACGVVIAVSIAFAPSSASAGFLDQLFGGGAAPSQPSFSFEPSQPQHQDFPYEPIKPRSSSHSKKVAIHEDPSARQQTTDLWHDKTLRPGDAIMMKTGLHVFRGPSSSLHMAKEFVPIGHSQVAPKQRAALLAMDMTPKSGKKGEVLQTGRSASTEMPISEGVRITDARGASVRYVGP